MSDASKDGSVGDLQHLSLSRSRELAVTDVRREFRRVTDQDFLVLFGLVALAGLVTGAWVTYDVGTSVGTSYANGEGSWLSTTGLVYGWSALWLAMAAVATIEAVGSNGDLANDGYYLTIRPTVDLVAARLLSTATKSTLFVAVPVAGTTAGICLGLGTPLPVVGSALASVAILASAIPAGYALGLAAKGAIRRSPVLSSLKPLLALVAAGGYVVLIVTGEITAVVDELGPLLEAPPLGSLSDLALLTTTGADASVTAAVTALVAASAVGAVGAVLAVPAARFAWEASGTPEDDDETTDVETAASEDRLDAAFATAGFAPESRTVAITRLRRVYREPFQLLFAVVPLIAAIPLAARIVRTGDVPWYAAWFVVWYGAWAAGAVLPLNPIGDLGQMLPTVLTARADGAKIVRGTVLAAAAPVAPATAAVAAVVGIAAGLPAHEVVAVAGAGVGAVVAAAVLAAGIGAVFPRFESLTVSDHRRMVPPSKVAYGVFSIALTLAVAGVAVGVSEPARTLGSVLAGRYLPFGVDPSAETLATVGWVLAATVAVAVPVAYRWAVHRIDDYQVA
ncbi:hypothetical protein [Halorubellus litoreus]|uniref:ABC-2 type transport system permease protein n=1 Tax=Halorubellus litoreus TaxID=755308 RepID=A0ABD5V906_9EURY